MGDTPKHHNIASWPEALHVLWDGMLPYCAIISVALVQYCCSDVSCPMFEIHLCHHNITIATEIFMILIKAATIIPCNKLLQ